MAGNIQPIFSRVGEIQGGAVLLAAANDYDGQNVNNQIAFTADPTNGGYVQRLRFKAFGTNVTTVCRIYINNGQGTNNVSSNVPQTLTGTGSSTGGNLLTSNLVARVASVDQWGVPSAFSTESANVSVSSASGTGSVTWNWNASSNSNTYILIVGPTPGSEEMGVKVVGANSYTMTSIPTTSIAAFGSANATQIFNNYFYGEVNLPATTSSATGATQDVDYPMNLALPPGYSIVVGLGTTVAAGWACIVIGGSY
jgi:hypothetical protein